MKGYVKISIEHYDSLKRSERDLKEKTIYIGTHFYGCSFKSCTESEAITQLKTYIESQEELIKTVAAAKEALLNKLKNRSWFARLFNL